jgi:hypothetical protein
MSVLSRPHSGRTLRWLSFLLFAAYVFFLWMFFAAESVEKLAIHSRPAESAAATTFEQAAFRFAAQWRHGMAGNSPLYMPGFFAVGVLTWLWALGRPLRRLMWEGFVLMVPAACVAALLSPWGAALALQDFERVSGLHNAATFPGISAVGAAQAIYTIVAWSSFVLCLQWSIVKRSVVPLLIPLVLMIILVLIRPWTVSEFVSQWLQETVAGHAAAVFSMAAAGVLFTAMILYQLHRRK